MKPNAIVLTDQGIGCIEAPEKPESSYIHTTSSLYINTQWYKETGGYKDPMTWYNEKLELAMKNVVLFKDKQLTFDMLSKQKCFPYEERKLYPIPDGYEIKIVNTGTSFKKAMEGYAILVPKQEPCNGTCGMNYCDENGCVERKRELVDNPVIQSTSIEEAAKKYADDYDGMQWEKDRVEIAFIKGTKWMQEQFKQEMK